jgi:hypothetical protein
MFSVQIFTEIFVVGSLLMLAVSPLLWSLLPTGSRQAGITTSIRSVTNAPVMGAIIVVLVYSIGIAGNRLIDDLFDKWKIDPGSAIKTDFASQAAQAGWNVKSLKEAEFSLLQNEGPREWLDRHKSFVRVLRGGCFASALFILTMLAGLPSKRYTTAHFIAAFLLLAIFSTAYVRESQKYKEHVAAIYRVLHSESLSLRGIPLSR